MENTNGNSTLNNSRESVNKNTSNYKYLGSTKKVAWDARRSFRSI
jgi:hypothetical protein